MTRTLRLGTRRSPLALHQAGLVRTALATLDPELQVEIVEIDSAADNDPRDLRDINERGIFASALEQQLREGGIDAAVHSSKDLALGDQPGLVLTAWLPRADPRDALVQAGCDLDEIEPGGVLATGSARRVAMLRALRPDLAARAIRGNVATRIARSRDRGDAGLVLAMAGLERLGLARDPSLDVRPLPVDAFVPEAGQGAVVVQARAQVCDRTGLDWSGLDDVATRRTVQLERELAALLGGGCERPVGVHAQLDAGRVTCCYAPDPDSPARTTVLDVMGLEIGTLVSVREPRDVDDAAAWTARTLAPRIADALGAPLAEVAR